MNKNSKDILIFLVPIAIVLGAAALLYFGQDSIFQNSSDKVADKALAYINENILPEGITASLIDITEEDGVYKLRLDVKGTEYQSYVSKSGKYLFPDVFILDAEVEGQQQSNQEISKQDIPDFKIFVFSYCPFSLQYEKGLLPVVDLFSSKANIKLIAIGAMHGEHEEIESKRQNCIREEQSDKYWAYLKCFVYNEGIKECSSKFYGEFNRDEAKMAQCIEPHLNKCFNEAKIDKSKIINCMKSEADDYYKSDMNLAKKYGVSSSPTSMVNEMIFNQEFCNQNSEFCTRSPEGIKNAICEGFKSKPPECSQKLSDEIPSAGFGGGTSSSGSGGCQ
ncbi:MAG: hypothetical protein ACKKMW_01685 [Candidatus Nealsonbacteria bacterium]